MIKGTGVVESNQLACLHHAVQVIVSGWGCVGTWDEPYLGPTLPRATRSCVRALASNR
jgi:hypothetical protein